MKKAMLGLALSAFLLSSCSAQEKSPVPEPQAHKNDAVNVWDLGQVKKGEKIERAFAFKNDSAKTITVASIQTSCGCTGSKIKDKTLSPEQSTAITVFFDSKGYRAGALEQFIYINTDDADNPIIKYTVKVEVID